MKIRCPTWTINHLLESSDFVQATFFRDFKNYHHQKAYTDHLFIKALKHNRLTLGVIKWGSSLITTIHTLKLSPQNSFGESHSQRPARLWKTLFVPDLFILFLRTKRVRLNIGWAKKLHKKDHRTNIITKLRLRAIKNMNQPMSEELLSNNRRGNLIQGL